MPVFTEARRDDGAADAQKKRQAGQQNYSRTNQMHPIPERAAHNHLRQAYSNKITKRSETG